MMANEEGLPWNQIQKYLEQYEVAIVQHDVELSRALLVESVQGFHPQCDVVDLVQETRIQRQGEERPDNIIHYPGKPFA